MAPLYTTPIARDGFDGTDTPDIDGRTPDGGGSGPLAVGTWAFHAASSGSESIAIRGNVGVRENGFADEARYRWDGIPSLPSTYRTESEVTFPDHESGDKCSGPTETTLAGDAFGGSAADISGRSIGDGTWTPLGADAPNTGGLQIVSGQGLTFIPFDISGLGAGSGLYYADGLTIPTTHYGARCTGKYAVTSPNQTGAFGILIRGTPGPGASGYLADLNWDNSGNGTVEYVNLLSGTGGDAVSVGALTPGADYTVEIHAFNLGPTSIVCVSLNGSVVITKTSNQSLIVGAAGVLVSGFYDGTDWGSTVQDFEVFTLDGIPGDLGQFLYATQEVMVRWDPSTETGYKFIREFFDGDSGDGTYYLEEWDNGALTGMRYGSTITIPYDTPGKISLEITPDDHLHAYDESTEIFDFDLINDLADDTSATVALHTTGDPGIGLYDGSGIGIFAELTEATVYWDGGGGGTPTVTVDCDDENAPGGHVRLTLTTTDPTWSYEIQRATDSMGTGAETITIGAPGGRGPQIWLVPSGVAINAGDDGQAIIDANPAGTTYIVGVGTHTGQSWIPKAGDTFVGADGATFAGTFGVILDGGGSTQYAIRRSGAGPNDVTIRGIRFTDYAPGSGSAMGPILAGGDAPSDSTTGWIIEDCEVDASDELGIRLGTATQVTRCRLHHNATLDFGGVGTDCKVAYCEISFGNAGTSNPDSGGCKDVLSTGIHIHHNWVHHNNGPGLWADIANEGYLIEDNLCEDNFQGGIVIEISFGGVIRNNVCRRNGLLDTVRGDAWGWSSGIEIGASGGSGLEIYGNYLEDNRHGITLLQQPRGTAHGDPSVLRADSVGITAEMYVQNVHVHDNIIAQPTDHGSSLHPVTGALDDGGSTAIATSRGNTFEDNAYYINAAITSPFAWQNAVHDFAAWQGYGNDTGGSFSTGAGPGAPDLGGGSIGLLPGTTTTYDDPRPQGETWCYRARAVLGAEVGEWSAWACCTSGTYPCEGPPENPWPENPPTDPPPGDYRSYIQVREMGVWRKVLVPTPALPGPLGAYAVGAHRPAQGFQARYLNQWKSPIPDYELPPEVDPPDGGPPPWFDPCGDLDPIPDPPVVPLDPPPERLYMCGQLPATLIGLFTLAKRAMGTWSLTEANQVQALGGFLMGAQGGYSKFIGPAGYDAALYDAWMDQQASYLNTLKVHPAWVGFQGVDDFASRSLWPPNGLSVAQITHINLRWKAVYGGSFRVGARARPSQWADDNYPAGIDFVSIGFSYWQGSSPAAFRDYELAKAVARGWKVYWVLNALNGGTTRGQEMTPAQVEAALVEFAQDGTNLWGTGLGFRYDKPHLARTGMLDAYAAGRNALGLLGPP